MIGSLGTSIGLGIVDIWGLSIWKNHEVSGGSHLKGLNTCRQRAASFMVLGGCLVEVAHTPWQTQFPYDIHWIGPG